MRGVELCDKEQMKEDETSSDEEGMYAEVNVKVDGEQEGEVSKTSAEEDIGRDTSFEHTEMNGKTSPIKSKPALGSLTKRTVCLLPRCLPHEVRQLFGPHRFRRRRRGSCLEMRTRRRWR